MSQHIFRNFAIKKQTSAMVWVRKPESWGKSETKGDKNNKRFWYHQTKGPGWMA